MVLNFVKTTMHSLHYVVISIDFNFHIEFAYTESFYIMYINSFGKQTVYNQLGERKIERTKCTVDSGYKSNLNSRRNHFLHK